MSKLIFIYNANFGKVNALLDTVHKVSSPKTYQCSLCTLTFDAFSENKQWKKFRSESTFEMVFLHKNEFQKKYASKFGAKYTFPVVLIENFENLEVFATPEELNNIAEVQELIQLIQDRGKTLKNN